jgi:hypothetical protein
VNTARRTDGFEPEELLLFGVGAAALVLSPPAALAAGVVATARWRSAMHLVVIAAGLAVCGVLLAVGALASTWGDGYRELLDGVLVHPGQSWSAAWPQLGYGWLLLLPLTPFLARAFVFVTPRSFEEQARAQEARAERRERRIETRAGKHAAGGAPLTARAGGQDGLVLGVRTAGEPALPCAGRWALITRGGLAHHVLVMGATGSGKTETCLRLAHTAAKAMPGAAVYYLDAKGDRLNAERFCGLMGDAGRRARVFPNEPFDGWRGDGRAIYNRLLEAGQYPSQGEGVHYRLVAKAVLQRVCLHPDGPPASSGEALERMDLPGLAAAHGPEVERELTAADVRDVRRRYAATFGALAGGADGLWAWEDTDAAYVLIDRQQLGEEAHDLARFFFDDFAHFFSQRKQRERLCLLVVDEFSAVAGAGGMASRVEQARAFNCALVLAPQVAAGMGDETEAERILGSAETVVLHRMNAPDDIAALAGTRLAPEFSQHFERPGEAGPLRGPRRPTGEGSVRLQHQFKVDPNEVRRLADGAAFVIRKGRAMKARIVRAPAVRASLPGASPPPQTAAVPAAPMRELPY